MILVCDAYRRDLEHPNEYIRGMYTKAHTHTHTHAHTYTYTYTCTYIYLQMRVHLCIYVCITRL